MAPLPSIRVILTLFCAGVFTSSHADTAATAVEMDTLAVPSSLVIELGQRTERDSLISANSIVEPTFIVFGADGTMQRVHADIPHYFYVAPSDLKRDELLRAGPVPSLSEFIDVLMAPTGETAQQSLDLLRAQIPPFSLTVFVIGRQWMSGCGPCGEQPVVEWLQDHYNERGTRAKVIPLEIFWDGKGLKDSTDQ